jgi:hypothetical protein
MMYSIILLVVHLSRQAGNLHPVLEQAAKPYVKRFASFKAKFADL